MFNYVYLVYLYIFLLLFGIKFAELDVQDITMTRQRRTRHQMDILRKYHASKILQDANLGQNTQNPVSEENVIYLSRSL